MSAQPSQASTSSSYYPPNGSSTTQSSVQPTPQPSSEGYTPSTSSATFGVDLGEQLARDSTEIPKVVQKCAGAIEAYGERYSSTSTPERELSACRSGIDGYISTVRDDIACASTQECSRSRYVQAEITMGHADLM
jgi:hypothetical protein